MKKTFRILSLLVLLMVSCKSTPQYTDLGEGLFAVLHTNQGDIVIQLEDEKTPLTVANFVALAEGNHPFVTDSLKGKRYYDGLTFHRVIEDFMIQGGDPLGTGTGGPGYAFKDEFHSALTHQKGVLSMANSGPATNGSQFFITHKATPWLNGRHSVFGTVVKGMEVVDAIAQVETNMQNKPKVAVVMQQVDMIRNGKAAEDFDAVQLITDYFAEE